MRLIHPLLLLATFVALAAPAGAQRVRGRVQFRVDTTFAFGARGVADIRVGNGDIIIDSWDRSQARVRIVSEDASYQVRVTDGRLSLDPDEMRDASARIEITVPAGTRLNVVTRNGGVRIDHIAADVSLRGQSGDARLAGITGRVDVSLMNGDFTGTGINGDVQVRTISGDAALDRVTGQVDVETVSGDIGVRDANTKWVRLHTTSGDVDYAGTVLATGRYELGAHSGDVTMTMPPDAGAQVTVSTFNGEIDSAFPITLAPGEHDIGIGRSKRFTFEVGHGDARVSLESFSGDITLRNRGDVRDNR